MFNVHGFIQDGRLGLCGGKESTLEHDNGQRWDHIHVGRTSVLGFSSLSCRYNIEIRNSFAFTSV